MIYKKNLKVVYHTRSIKNGYHLLFFMSKREAYYVAKIDEMNPFVSYKKCMSHCFMMEYSNWLGIIIQIHSWELLGQGSLYSPNTTKISTLKDKILQDPDFFTMVYQ